MQAFDGEAEHIYVVTLSAELSGSYNSACLAKKIYEEKHPEKKIHVFNSCSASVGETLIGLKAEACELAGMSFEETVKTLMRRLFRIYAHCYWYHQEHFMALNTLDHLNRFFSRFIWFAKEFDLITQSELEPIKNIVDKAIRGDLCIRHG